MSNEEQNNRQEFENALRQFIGTTRYYAYGGFFGKDVYLTDGVKYLAEHARCFWLLDVICSYQGYEKLDQNFQVWTLNVFSKEEAEKKGYLALVKGRNDTKSIVTQKIPFTDFPLEKIKLYYIDGVILLPSEY
jgi:hypothetical protein